ncbi:MAG: CZB domain-containing protein [Gammaproteobacteria bacterium]
MIRPAVDADSDSSSWFPGGDTADSAGQAHELDVQTAIVEHLEWCMLFNDRLAGYSLLPGQPDTLPGATESKLGQWIARNGNEAAGQHPSFAALRDEHRRFHELAQQALNLARQNRMDQASTLLNTDFERSRVRVVELLRHIQRG